MCIPPVDMVASCDTLRSILEVVLKDFQGSDVLFLYSHLLKLMNVRLNIVVVDINVVHLNVVVIAVMSI